MDLRNDYHITAIVSGATPHFLSIPHLPLGFMTLFSPPLLGGS